GQVLPEERVQHVPREMERQRLLERHDRGEVLPFPGLRQPLQRLVQAVHVGGVVLAVMQLESARVVVGLEVAVVVAELWQRVAQGRGLLSVRTGGRTSRGRARRREGRALRSARRSERAQTCIVSISYWRRNRQRPRRARRWPLTWRASRGLRQGTEPS